MELAMVPRTQGGEILDVGSAALGPGDQVVVLQEASGDAAGEAAAAVAVLDQLAGAWWDDPHRSTDRHRGGVLDPDRAHGSVAGEFPQ